MRFRPITKHESGCGSRTSPLSLRSAARCTATLGILLFLVAACATGSETKSWAGTWTGYLGMGSNTSGYNTMTIDKDHNVSLVGQITITNVLVGNYQLRFAGEPTLRYGHVSGDITITRYWPGVDTVAAQGRWLGDFDRPSSSATGIWETKTGAPFNIHGNWAATKQKE